MKREKATVLKELPWRIARAGIPNGEPCNNVISKESMMYYYGGLNGQESNEEC